MALYKSIYYYYYYYYYYYIFGGVYSHLVFFTFVVGPRKARNTNFDSDQRIGYPTCFLK